MPLHHVGEWIGTTENSTRTRWLDRRVEPGTLLRELLTHLREQAGQQIAAMGGQAPTQVWLTLPALYGPTEEGLIRMAATKAGFGEVAVIPEPVAAARAWLAETGEASADVVVVDCGGGTSDWAYLRRQGEDFDIVASCPPWGDSQVGGPDVDTELLEQLKEQVRGGGAGIIGTGGVLTAAGTGGEGAVLSGSPRANPENTTCVR